jgi:hypothetical protein
MLLYPQNELVYFFKPNSIILSICEFQIGFYFLNLTWEQRNFNSFTTDSW